MTKYTVYNKQNQKVGHTTNQTELTNFLAAHPGYSQRSEGWPDDSPESTLPKLQEEPEKPTGDFLRQ